MKHYFLKCSRVLVASILAVSAVNAQETNEVEQLRNELREMREKMSQLEQRVEASEAAPSKTSAAALPAKRGNTYMDVGLVATFAAGGSTASDIEGGTQLGGHDPNQRGFTVQGAELNLQEIGRAHV